MLLAKTPESGENGRAPCASMCTCLRLQSRLSSLTPSSPVPSLSPGQAWRPAPSREQRDSRHRLAPVAALALSDGRCHRPVF